MRYGLISLQVMPDENAGLHPAPCVLFLHGYSETGRWRDGRVAEGDGLLNRYTESNPYPGFESPSLRFCAENRCFPALFRMFCQWCQGVN